MSSVAPAAPASGSGDTRIIVVVGIAHAVSHFFHLILPPLFPWLKDAFGLSYSELGVVVTVFFVISGIGQSLAGFVVDRVGPVPVMLGAITLFALSAAVLASASGYAGLMLGAALAGVGNASFHPVDYSILNRKVSGPRLGHAYAVHGITGNLGWAAAPVFVVTIAQFAGWREAFAGAALVALAALAVVWLNRSALAMQVHRDAQAAVPGRGGPGGAFDFLRLPAVWLSFGFFFAYAVALGGVQTFAPEASRLLHGVPLEWVALCLTIYMLGSAGGTIIGGFLASDPHRAERIIGVCFGLAAAVAVSIALLPWPGWTVPLLFGVMGVCGGIANPSRDMLIRRAAPPGATGRVYGVVYSGLDVGMSIAPPIFGVMMDMGMPALVWVGVAFAQATLIAGAFRAGRATRMRDAAPGAA
ncbi:MAG: MFS transporter [Burkholderiaceae bacterium]|nr:MFS transporter [Burkholderiaceae bacterium]MEB2351090.1 MFS transporter [Burkholderiaceae bacterium]